MFLTRIGFYDYHATSQMTGRSDLFIEISAIKSVK